MSESPTSDLNQQWLQQLYLQAPVPIATYIGKEHIIEFANTRMCELWGRNQDQILNKPLFEALPEVANQGFEEILAEVLATGEPFSGNELPATIERNKQLELCYFNILYQPLKDNNNQVIGIIQVATEVTELVASRIKAERNEEILRLAIEGGKMGTWHLDFVQGKTIQSIEHAKIFGYQEVREDWNYNIYLEHILPEDRIIVENSINLGTKSGHINYEVRIRQATGDIRWTRVTGKAIYNLKGKPVSLAGVVMDITEQKEHIIKERQLAVERAAREEAEKQKKALNELLGKAPALICTFYGPKFIFGFVNPQYQQLFPGRKLEGLPMLEALPELKDQPLFEIIAKVYNTGETFNGNELPVQIDRTGTGKLETGYFNINYQAIRNSKEQIKGVLLFAFDVTEQILAKKRIENNEQSLRLALEAGKMGIWHMDLLTDTSSRSMLHDQIFGYSKRLPVWGYSMFMQHIIPEDRDAVADQFDIARRYGELRFEARILGGDQKLRWIFLKGQTFYEQDKPITMAGVVMDITERKVVEEKLKELTEELAASNMGLLKANEEIQSHIIELSQINNRLKLTNADLDNFVYTASHDLKTPISNIEGLMKLLVRNLPPEILNKEAVQKPISLIEASTDRFKQTILELTNIASLQKEEAEAEEHTAISPVLNEVLLDLQLIIDETGAQIEAEIEQCFDSCSQLPLSHKNLKSILYNLLSNAIKYHSPERIPKIRIRCQQQDYYNLLTVEDNGLGLKQKDISKIFSMFTRMHTHVEGSGVGLYLVKRIMDNIEGKLEVESEEGKGTTFKVFFPAK